MEEITPTLVSKPDVVLRDGVWSKERWIVVVQSLIHVQLFVTRWTAACQASLSITNSLTLLKFMSIESVMPSNHLILCSPLLLPPQSIPASGSFLMSQFFASGGQSIGASASVLPMNIQDWSPLGWTGWVSLNSKGLLKSLIQYHSSKASSLQRSASLIVQLSHPYMTTEKTTALTGWNFVGEVMSLLFKMLSRLWSQMDYSTWDSKESDTTEQLT